MGIDALYAILVFLWIMIIVSIPKPDTVGCAGIKTYPECAKFCTHSAVATCESSVKQRIRDAGNAISQSAQQLNQKSIRKDHEHEPTIWESVYGCKQEVWLLNKCGKE
jgi:hypothetical protein